MRVLREAEFQLTWAEARRYWNTPMDQMNDLPSSWDWRNVNGYDFTSKVRDQGGCGSCYAMSFIGTLESRAKILTGQ